MIPRPVSTAITSSSFVAVKLPDAPDSQVPVGMYTEDSSAFYVATESDGSDAVLVPADAPKPATRGRVEADGTICYVKGTTSTNLITWRWRP